MKRVLFNFKMMIASVAMTCVVAGVFTSCDKELYSEKDAQAEMDKISQRKLDAEKAIAELGFANNLAVQALLGKIQRVQDSIDYMQNNQVDVTILVKDVTDPDADMTGFTVMSSQFYGDVSKTTNKEGLATVRIMGGEALILISKPGYSRTLAYVVPNGVNAYAVPIFPSTKDGSKVTGTLYGPTDLTQREMIPVPGVALEISLSNVLATFFNTPGYNNVLLQPSHMIYEDKLNIAVTDADGKFSFDVPKTKNAVSYTVSLSGAQQVSVKGYSATPPNGTDEIDLVTTKAWTSFLTGTNMTEFGKYQNSVYRFAALNISIDAPEAGESVEVERGRITVTHTDRNIRSEYKWKGSLEAEYRSENFPTYSFKGNLFPYVTNTVQEGDLNFVFKQTADPPPVKFLMNTNNKIYRLDKEKVEYDYTIDSNDGHNNSASLRYLTFEQATAPGYWDWAPVWGWEWVHVGYPNGDYEPDGFGGYTWVDYPNGNYEEQYNVLYYDDVWVPLPVGGKVKASITAQLVKVDATTAKLVLNIANAGKGYDAVPNILATAVLDTATINRNYYGLAIPNYDPNLVFFKIDGVADKFKLNEDGGLEFKDASTVTGYNEIGNIKFPNVKIGPTSGPGKIDFDWDTHSGRLRMIGYTQGNTFGSFTSISSANLYLQSYIVRYNSVHAGHYDANDSKYETALRVMDWDAEYLFVTTPSAGTSVTMTSKLINLQGFTYAINKAGEYTAEPMAHFYSAGKIIAQAKLKIDTGGGINGEFSDFKILDNTNWTGSITGSIYIPPRPEFVKQAFARAEVNADGEVTGFVHYNNFDSSPSNWLWGSSYSGNGYTSVPEVTVEAVGDDFKGTLPDIKAYIDDDGSVRLNLAPGGSKGKDIKRNYTPVWPLSVGAVTSVSTNGSEDVSISVNLNSLVTGLWVPAFEQ